jgi:ATP-dependent protease ClpP protease subunit
MDASEAKNYGIIDTIFKKKEDEQWGEARIII